MDDFKARVLEMISNDLQAQDSIEISKGITGGYGWKIKTYGCLDKESKEMTEKLLNLDRELREKLNGASRS